jgi:hypothetical protein
MDEWELIGAVVPDDRSDVAGQCGDCKVGDHVSAPRAGGLYRHHGVLLDGNEVYHVNAGPHQGLLVCLGLSPAMVRVDPVVRFLKGAACLTREAAAVVPIENITALRHGAGATTEYNLLINNCEHHATAAVGRTAVSWQSRRFALVVLLAALATGVAGPMAGGGVVVGLGRKVADGVLPSGCGT